MPPRVFTAIPLPATALRLLAAAREAFLDEAPSWRGEKWVAEENLHVTLRFIGRLEDGAQDACVASLAAAAEENEPFGLELRALRAKPGAKRATMLWASALDPSSSCARLAERLCDALAPFGVASDPRPYTPHVTLGRARRPLEAPREALEAGSAVLANGKDPERYVSVPAFTLVSSTLTPSGPVYEEIASFRLGGR